MILVSTLHDLGFTMYHLPFMSSIICHPSPIIYDLSSISSIIYQLNIFSPTAIAFSVQAAGRELAEALNSMSASDDTVQNNSTTQALLTAASLLPDEDKTSDSVPAGWCLMPLMSRPCCGASLTTRTGCVKTRVLKRADRAPACWSVSVLPQI